MIGVISAPHQAREVEEFFELFKTPWEFFRSGVRYDVIFTNGGNLDLDCRLMVQFGSDSKTSDRILGLETEDRTTNGELGTDGTFVPIYNELLTFSCSDKGMPILHSRTGPVAIKYFQDERVVIRVGYDPFAELRFLLSVGQPTEKANVATLDFHVEIIRKWMIEAGVPFLEILPTPAGFDFIACLTHDIDFVGIRNHFFDHSMWGFLYRATAGSLSKFLKGRVSFERLLASWRAALSLPFVYLGLMKDFWEPFEWYLEAEKELPATYFLIPFKGHAGENVPGRHAEWRASAYELGELSERLQRLREHKCELGVHGIDSWHNPEKGNAELEKLFSVCPRPDRVGIRMHWLLQDSNTPAVLESAGYFYDSSRGYNETVGYQCGTGQVFRPLQTTTLLEIPLHIQDGALFYPQRLNLSDSAAEDVCQTMIRTAKQFGGVLTILWHDRSHGPERFWGDFYKKLIATLRSSGAWFASALQAVEWFKWRREVRFECITENGHSFYVPRSATRVAPACRVRVFEEGVRKGGSETPRGTYREIVWDGSDCQELILALQSTELNAAARASAIGNISA